MQTFLNQKAEIYVRFAENALRQKNYLTDSPAPKQMVIKSKREGKVRADAPVVEVKTDELDVMKKMAEDEVAIQEQLVIKKREDEERAAEKKLQEEEQAKIKAEEEAKKQAEEAAKDPKKAAAKKEKDAAKAAEEAAEGDEKKDAPKKEEVKEEEIPETLRHPVWIELDKINEHIKYFEDIKTPEDFKKYAYERLLRLHDPVFYRQKIKGFHLAFNVREKLVEEGITDGTFKPKKVQYTAKELADRAEVMKTQRLRNAEIREKVKQDQILNEREHFRQYHEGLRRKNRQELAEGMGLSDSMDRLGSYKSLKQRQEEMLRIKDEELKAQR